MNAPEVDADLARAVRTTGYLRTGFYIVVLLIALGGQVSGAMEALHMRGFVALPAVGALELGGIVVLANADVRRRLGEHAALSQLLSAAIALGAVAFNWLAHANHLEGGFYGGMSLLGYLVYLMNSANKRRDRLRAKRQLPATAPAYGTAQWLRHPWLTRRARALALANPQLGLYRSLTAAAAGVKAERRQAALSKVLHSKIRNSVDGPTADIAIAVYDLDEIASRLTERADYDGLTDLIAADLVPARIAGDATTQKSDALALPGRRTPVTQSDAPVTHPGGAPKAIEGDAARQAPRTAVTRPDAPAPRRGKVVMRRPVSAPPMDPAERDAALRRAVDAVLTQGIAQRAAGRTEGLAEATVRRAVDRAKAEATQSINGYDHSSQN